MESSSPTFERAQLLIDYERRYDELLGDFKNICGEVGISYEWYNATLGILEEVRWAFDGKAPWIACGNLEGLPKALAVASTIEEFWGSPVYKPAVVSAYAGHDSGKIDLPYEWNRDSHEGKIWTDWHEELKKLHPGYSAERARRRGFPMLVWRPIEESHGKQLTPCYGRNPVLSGEELHVRNAVGIADCVDAMFGRDNTLNDKMSFEDRIAYCENYVRNMCGDYSNGGPQLANLLIDRVVPRPRIIQIGQLGIIE